MIQLDPRLQQVADLVAPDRRLTDVGTDHGYLIAHLVGSGKTPGGVACDINVQPLDRARQTLAQEGLADRVACIRSDGLQAVPPEEAKEIVIAGMGGDLIAAILQAVPWVRDPDRHLVLQPMSKAEHLRRFLYQEGFAILEERAVASGEFVYSVLSVRYSGEKPRYSLLDEYIGAVCSGGTADTGRYLGRVAGDLRRKVAGMEQSAVQREQAAAYRTLLQEIQRRREEIP